MSCIKCKKKEEINDLYKNIDFDFGVGIWPILGVVVWTMFGLYGFYSVIVKLYELF